MKPKAQASRVGPNLFKVKDYDLWNHSVQEVGTTSLNWDSTFQFSIINKAKISLSHVGPTLLNGLTHALLFTGETWSSFQLNSSIRPGPEQSQQTYEKSLSTDRSPSLLSSSTEGCVFCFRYKVSFAFIFLLVYIVSKENRSLACKNRSNRLVNTLNRTRKFQEPETQFSRKREGNHHLKKTHY